MKNSENLILLKIKRWITFFIIALVLSGITAFPLATELAVYEHYLSRKAFLNVNFPQLIQFLNYVSKGVFETSDKFPFLLYGTDWLAFAHVMFAVLFVGVYRNPVRNKWIVEFGMIACVSIIPLAFICGPIRGIPFYWTLIDCSFGVFGIIPLWIVRRYIIQLESN